MFPSQYARSQSYGIAPRRRRRHVLGSVRDREGPGGEEVQSPDLITASCPSTAKAEDFRWDPGGFQPHTHWKKPITAEPEGAGRWGWVRRTA